MHRRDLLKMSGSLTLSGIAIAAPVKGGAATPSFTMSKAGFTLLVRQQFWLNHPVHKAMPLVLTGVVSPNTKTKPARAEQFSLLFQSPSREPIEDGVYELENPATGRFMLHLVPAGKEGAAQRYRADFNLLI